MNAHRSITIETPDKLYRTGVKGPRAAQWLADQGIALPGNPNAWMVTHDQLRVLRLGHSEYLLECAIQHPVFAQITEASQPMAAGVYRVPRADAVFMLYGEGIMSLLAEVCALNLSERSLAEDGLFMTLLAGIPAIVIRQTISNLPSYRIWCDGTYAAYLREILQEIAHDLSPLCSEF